MEFVDNQGLNNLALIQALSANGYDGLVGTEWDDAFNKGGGETVSGYTLVQGALYGTFRDILTEGEDRIILNYKLMNPRLLFTVFAVLLETCKSNHSALITDII